MLTLFVNCIRTSDWKDVQRETTENFDLDHYPLQIKTSPLSTKLDLLVNFTVAEPNFTVVLQKNEAQANLTLEICSEKIVIADEATYPIDLNQENIWSFKKTSNSLELLHGETLSSLIRVDIGSLDNECRDIWANPTTTVSFQQSDSSSLQFTKGRSTCYDRYVKRDILNNYCTLEPSLNQYECGQQALSITMDGYFAWYEDNISNTTSCWICSNSEELTESSSYEETEGTTFLVENSCVGK